jgi:hypothetical protein
VRAKPDERAGETYLCQSAYTHGRSHACGAAKYM